MQLQVLLSIGVAAITPFRGTAARAHDDGVQVEVVGGVVRGEVVQLQVL